MADWCNSMRGIRLGRRRTVLLVSLLSRLRNKAIQQHNIELVAEAARRFRL